MKTYLKDQDPEAFLASHKSTGSGFVLFRLCCSFVIIVDGFNCHFNLMLIAKKSVSIIHLQEQRGSSEVPICLLWLQARVSWAVRSIVFSGTKMSL